MELKSIDTEKIKDLLWELSEELKTINDETLANTNIVDLTRLSVAFDKQINLINESADCIEEEVDWRY